MNKLLIYLFLLTTGLLSTAQVFAQKEIAPGVIKLEKGEIDTFTPYSLFGGKPIIEAMKSLPTAKLPFDTEEVQIKITDRGCLIEVPLEDNEQIYGFGLQFETFGQRGLRKRPIVNDNPLNGLGYTHAPQTFYVSTKGYGILVNTARYTTFLCGSNQKTRQSMQSTEVRKPISTTTEDLYKNRSNGDKVFIDVPGAKGIEVFIITGPELLDVVKRYNLLSGGGCLPPMWGLGFKYRVKGDATQDSVMRFANYFRNNNIPCDVLGLEPGWQTATYSCSYIWNKERFPQHKEMLTRLQEKGYKVNLWEHAYVHPTSPIRKELEPYSGDFLVWNGLVPDFIKPEAHKIFTGYHRTLIDEGISGFKLDECDNSNISFASATWCFPDLTQFPSGIDGEKMHQIFGSLYVNAMDSIYRAKNTRAYQDYRSSGMFMSPRSAVLYSDTYDPKEYIQALCNSAFGGLLWCPEVREAHSAEDFFHRLQTVILSPQAMINAWYLQYAPWLQFDRGKNERGEFLPEAKQYEEYARTLINLRMELIPYLYTAFRTYQQEGIPPFRPLLMDDPKDERLRTISDQYMIGNGMMAAPLYENKKSRKVYFPEGVWYNFNTNEKYEGNREYEITTELNQLPLYVRQGTLLPLAEPVPYINTQTVFNLNCKIYGTPTATCQLFEDDGVSYDFQKGQFNQVTLNAAKGKVKLTRTKGCKIKRYQLKGYEFIN
jgi:alpha-D-xyloside xylohydrolase